GGYTNGTLSACIIATSTAITGLDIRDNTLSNTLVGLEGSTPTCIHHAGTNTVFNTIDYNNYYIDEAGPGYIGKLGATWYQTFPEWQAATLQDLSSLGAFPDYTADDNLAPFPSSPLIGAGTFIESLPFDILGNPRINPPTIGAYEVDLGDDLPPPSLISPLNNSIGVPRLTQFLWNAVEGATSYYLQVATDAEFTDIIVGLSVPTTSHTLATQLAATTQFYWRAKGEAEGVIGYWSQGWKFITEGPLDAPVLISPLDGSEGLAPDNPLDWEAVFGANMYNIQIATDADFSEIIVDENIAGTVYYPSTLALQSDYWWRVSATNGTNISPWSEIWAYSTGSIVTIGNGTTYNTSSGYPAPYGRFYWGARHQILITAAEFLAAGGLPGLITSLSFDIFAVNNCDALGDFTVKMKPTTQTTLTTFEYDGFTTVYVAAPSYLPIVGWNTHTFDTPFEWDGASNILIETCFFTNVTYTQNASHYYTVTPVNTVAYYRQDSNPTICSDNPISPTYSPNRPNMRFTMDISGLLPPQLSAPLNNSLGNPVTPLFDWEDVIGGTSYTLQVSTTADFSNLVLEQTGLETSQYQVTEEDELNESSLYYWRANASDGSVESYWSQVWIFVTTGPLPPVTLLTPANVATGVIVLPTFTWQALIGAENYEFELSNTPDFANIIYNTNGLINPSFTLPADYALENNATYYWRVRGYTGDNIGLWSEVWSFTTMIMVNNTSYLFVEEDEFYTEFTDGTATNVTGDDAGANFDLPFTFVYAGAEFNSVRICTNGWVRLGGGTLNSLGNNLASTTDIKMLAPLWDDLYIAAGTGDITYRVEGAEPNRVYAVQFRNIYRLGASTDLCNFQVRIYESSGFITFNYGSMTAAYTGWTASVGINGLVGGIMDFISVTPGVGGNNATASSTVSNNSIDATVVPALANKKYTFMPMGNYVTLLSPYNNTLTETDVTLTWEALEGATTYHLMVSDSPDFLTTIVDNDALTGTSFDLEDLDPVTMHYWKVRALVGDEWTY
ncbi:MAG TPA: hypothetical protein PK762_12510, partial [Candidatus Kapabacteria bacterium]|nr:hypothetical protein [Candidatus Kapabacteria bacterium]